MEFKDLKIGDTVYILESIGTFRKITTYNIGQVVNVTQLYDDNALGNQYLQQMLKKKLVDITISCEGIQKKLTVSADKTTITDNAIGLTVSTNKQELITLVESQYKECQAKILSIELYKNEAEKCKRILSQLQEEPNKEHPVQESTQSVSLIKVS